MPVQQVRVEPPVLPEAVTPPIPVRIGVVYPESLRTANIETAYWLMRDRYALRHDIGEATVASLRQALRAAFAEVVELERLPDERAPRNDLAAIIVPAIDAMSMEMPANSVTTLLRESLRLDLALHSAAGTPIARWQVAGVASLGAHGPLFMRQPQWDQATLRSAMAALIASVHQGPALAGLRPPVAEVPGAPAPAAAPGPAGAAVVLRLDAGLARDDGIETRIARCLAPAIRGPAGEADPQPAATLRERLFPWLEPGTAPLESARIAELLARPEVRETLRARNVTHLVLLGARDADRTRTDHLLCAAGFNAGACFGIFEQSQGYVVDLAVWDVTTRRALDTAATDVRRTLGVLGVLVPLPYTYTNHQEACDKMREAVTGALAPRP